MRILIAVDWSDEAFAAVRTALMLYRPEEVALLHAVDLRPFDQPLLAPAVAKKAFEEFREAMERAGQDLLDRSAQLLPEGITVSRRRETGNPAAVILDAVEKTRPDLAVLGTRRRGRLTELALGSVSHRVLLHGACSTLLVKRPLTALRRVLVAVEGYEDAERIQRWLRRYPFQDRTELRVLSTVPELQLMDPTPIPALEPWDAVALRGAQDLVHDVATMLTGERFQATGTVSRGEAVDAIVRESAEADLVVIGSHGRKGLTRFLMGSVSHAVSHRVACPVLVVREGASS
ncbi:universal stress protein [Candidatus Nitrospira bockiana]